MDRLPSPGVVHIPILPDLVICTRSARAGFGPVFLPWFGPLVLGRSELSVEVSPSLWLPSGRVSVGASFKGQCQLGQP